MDTTPSAAAIWARPALWTQMNSTSGTSLATAPLDGLGREDSAKSA